MNPLRPPCPNLTHLSLLINAATCSLYLILEIPKILVMRPTPLTTPTFLPDPARP